MQRPSINRSAISPVEQGVSDSNEKMVGLAERDRGFRVQMHRLPTHSRLTLPSPGDEIPCRRTHSALKEHSAFEEVDTTSPWEFSASLRWV